MAAAEVESILTLVPHLLEIPYKRIWTTYDEEADVLYVNFKKPSGTRGAIEVFDYSAKDGSVIDLNVIPVVFEG